MKKTVGIKNVRLCYLCKIVFTLILALVLWEATTQTASAVTYVLHATGSKTDYAPASALFIVDTQTGMATEVGKTGAGYWLMEGDLAYDPTNNILYGLGQNTLNSPGPTDSTLFKVNPLTGVATPLGCTGPGFSKLNSGGLTYDSVHNILYATGEYEVPDAPGTYISSLFTFNPLTGEATVVGPTGGETHLEDGGLAYDSLHNILYATGAIWTPGQPVQSALFRINPDTGLATLIGFSGEGIVLNTGGLAFDPVKNILYAIGDKVVNGQWISFLFTIDSSTGIATLVGPTGLYYRPGGLTLIPLTTLSLPTPSGSDVTISLPNGGSITYGNVDSACNTTFSEISNPTHNPPPNFNFIRYGYFDISTNCLYTGPVTVVYPYDEAEIRGQEQNLKLFHWKNNGWEDCTVSVDTVNNTITGRVDTLSPFGIGYFLSGGGGGGYTTGANENMIALIAILAISAGVFILRRQKRLYS